MKLIGGDCRNVLLPAGGFPNGSVDVVMTDPPHNWKKDMPGDNQTDSDYYAWLRQCFRAIDRVMKPDSWFITDTPRITLAEYLQVLREFWTFDDLLGIFIENSMHNGKFGIDRFYLKIVCRKGNPRVFQRRANAVTATFWTKAKGEFLHPTQKPQRPYTYFLEMFSKPGDTILDPFMGSGTTGIAVEQLGQGREFIGIEIDPTFFQDAKERIEAARQARIAWSKIDSTGQLPKRITEFTKRCKH